LCTEDKDAEDVFRKTAARLRSVSGWRHRELAVNHLAPINAPHATAEALLELA
jgi:hypothetical protein